MVESTTRVLLRSVLTLWAAAAFFVTAWAQPVNLDAGVILVSRKIPRCALGMTLCHPERSDGSWSN
jgi:hypothetical protein